MNEYDSNRIADLFKSKGYSQSFDSENTDLYLLTTCHIREKATEKVYDEIGRVKKNFNIIKELENEIIGDDDVVAIVSNEVVKVVK